MWVMPLQEPEQQSSSVMHGSPTAEVQQPEVSKVQLAVQESEPDENPSDAQVFMSRFMPSQSSPASITPLPQSVQAEVLNMHEALQLSVPPSKPPGTEVQLAPSRLGPSHCSPPLMMPSPQSEHAETSSVHPIEQESVPLS